MPKVSVIVPNFNHKDYLEKRIASILGQEYTDFELILLDDCSTDGSREMLLSYRSNPHVTHVELNSRNIGKPFMQWEKGIQLAQGDYIWIAESDDYAESDFLFTTVALLDSHPEARLCLTGSYIVDEHDNLIPSGKYGFDLWDTDGKCYFFASSDYLAHHMLAVNSVYNASMVLFRRENCLRGIVPCFRDMRYCGDWLFWVEQIRKGGVIEVHRKLNYFRKHSENTTAKGTNEGNSLGEIAFIRNLMHKHYIADRTLVYEDRILFYRIVRNFPVSSVKRKKELLKTIAEEGNFTYLNYKLTKLRLSMRWKKLPLFSHCRRD